jgi:hypothetical protein
MKRCDNCGYENQANNERCDKCGARLGDPVSQDPESNPPASVESQAGGKKTVIGKPVDKPFIDESQASSSPEIETDGKCPKCGYPARPDATACPNCGFQLADASAKVPPPAGKKTIAMGDFSGFGEESQPSFELLSDKGEESHRFKGASVMLNRENLEEDNMTLSGNEHAQLTFVEGKWQIEDKSSNGATFVQANRPIELEDGDMIILGQKIFRFRLKK